MKSRQIMAIGWAAAFGSKKGRPCHCPRPSPVPGAGADPVMGRAMQLCSLLCLATASCTFWRAFVSPSSGGPPKALKASPTPARASPVVQRASTQGVSLAAPLCLLAVVAVARSSKRKAVKRHPVVLLSASTRPLPPAQNSVAPSYSELISVEAA
eukprot:s2363_g16.t1